MNFFLCLTEVRIGLQIPILTIILLIISKLVLEVYKNANASALYNKANMKMFIEHDEMLKEINMIRLLCKFKIILFKQMKWQTNCKQKVSSQN